MPRTPDRKPGQLIEDDSILFGDRGSATGEVGTVYRVGDDLFAHDSLGEFSIRQGAASSNVLHQLIILTTGAVVYDSNGEIVHKVNP